MSKKNKNNSDELKTKSPMENFFSSSESEEIIVDSAPSAENQSESLEDQLDRLAEVLSEVESSNEEMIEQTASDDETAQEADSESDLDLDSSPDSDPVSDEDELEQNRFEADFIENNLSAEFDESEQEESQENTPIEADAENSDTEVEPFGSSSVNELDAAELESAIEALLFVSHKPVSKERLAKMLGESVQKKTVEEAAARLIERYAQPHHGFELAEISGGYQFRTKPSKADVLKSLVKVQTQRLSGGGMEALAIVAYQQPVMKDDIDKIRGVDSSYFIRNLLERKLIRISGRSELPGRPMLYETTSDFLEIFGLKDLSSLPSLREIEQMIPTSETTRPEDEDPKIRDMRKMISEMRLSRESALYFNPKEDEEFLKEIRQRVKDIPVTTASLEEEKEEAKAEKLKAESESEDPSQEDQDNSEPLQEMTANDSSVEDASQEQHEEVHPDQEQNLETQNTQPEEEEDAHDIRAASEEDGVPENQKNDAVLTSQEPQSPVEVSEENAFEATPENDTLEKNSEL